MKHFSNCIALSCDKGWMSDSTKRVDDIYRIKPLTSTPISPRRSLSPLSSFIHGSIEIHVFAWTFGHKTMIWKIMRISFYGYQSSKSTSFSSFSSPSFTRSNFITPMQSGTLSIVMYLVRKRSSDAFTQNLGWFENKESQPTNQTWPNTRHGTMHIVDHLHGEIICSPILIVIIPTSSTMTHLVTLSPQNSVMTVCPVTPSTFMIIFLMLIFLWPLPPRSTFAVDLWINLFPSTVTIELEKKKLSCANIEVKFETSRWAAALPHFPLVRGDFVEPLPDPELEVDSPGCDGSR